MVDFQKDRERESPLVVGVASGCGLLNVVLPHGEHAGGDLWLLPLLLPPHYALSEGHELGAGEADERVEGAFLPVDQKDVCSHWVECQQVPASGDHP